MKNFFLQKFFLKIFIFYATKCQYRLWHFATTKITVAGKKFKKGKKGKIPEDQQLFATGDLSVIPQHGPARGFFENFLLFNKILLFFHLFQTMKERHIKVEDLMKSFNPHSSDDPQQSHAIRHGHLGIQHHIKVEDLLKSFKTHSSEDPQQSHASRQGRLRAHHRHLLDSVVNADLQTVNAPGFPKSAHSKNPTSTFIKPDMMISAFTAGLTTEQAIMEMSLPGNNFILFLFCF